ncbi:MAG: hypothetical protein V4515_01625 [Chloroflexota bacterium]
MVRLGFLLAIVAGPNLALRPIGWLGIVIGIYGLQAAGGETRQTGERST